MHQKIESLENHGDIPARIAQFARGKIVHDHTVDNDLTLCWALQKVDATDERAFPGTAHSDNSVNIPVVDTQIDVLERLHRILGSLKCLIEVFDFNHVFLP